MPMKTLTTARFASSPIIGTAMTQLSSDLKGLEIAQVAYIAYMIDIGYAHLALAISKSSDIHTFANTMICGNLAVNEQALALLTKLNIQPQGNFPSQNLSEDADQRAAETSQLSDVEFDKRYAENELDYHHSVKRPAITVVGTPSGSDAVNEVAKTAQLNLINTLGPGHLVRVKTSLQSTGPMR